LQGTGSTPNVTLQAAALTTPGANNPPIVSLTSPGYNSTFSAGSDLPIIADATDAGGSVDLVEFFAGATKIGQATARPFGVTWTNATAGDQILTAKATDNGGASTLSRPVEIFVNGTGGALSGSTMFPPASLDLTAEGTSDWAHWGLITPKSFDHKAGVLRQISDLTVFGTNRAQRFTNNYTADSWSDGAPTATAGDTQTGLFIYGLTNGFRLTAPADTDARTLKVYAGLYGGKGNFQAYLSDFSAPAYTATPSSEYYGNFYAVYTLDYAAASAGQTLTVRYTADTLFDADYGNVTFQAASLSGAAAPTNAPPTVAITSPTNDASFAAPATIVIVAQADDDGTISLVEFFNSGTKLGQTSVSPYTFAWTNVPAGSYTLTARATDNLSATTDSIPVVISVTGAPSSVLLQDPGTVGGEFHFSFAAQDGFTYFVQSTDSFNPINWQPVTNFTGNGTTVVVTNTVTSAERFYRVEVH
jgi:hypothetical protein